jgi:hypothetical protein
MEILNAIGRDWENLRDLLSPLAIATLVIATVAFLRYRREMGQPLSLD